MATKNRLDISKVREKMKAASQDTSKDKPREPVMPVAETAKGYSFTEDNVKKVPIREIDPAKCTPWRYHNRSIDWLNEKHCKDLIESIRKNGQQEPGMVRLLDDGRYEVIYGVRRWFSCKFLGVPFKAKVVNKDDRECMILMHVENADSKDISDFERALSFYVQFNSGEFKSKKDMAESLGIPLSTLGRFLSAAEIYDYPWINEVLSSPIDISLVKANNLSSLLRNVQSRQVIKENFDIIKGKIDAGETLTANNVFAHISKALSSQEEKSFDKAIESLSALTGVDAKIDSKGSLKISVSSKGLKNKKELQKRFLDVLNLI